MKILFPFIIGIFDILFPNNLPCINKIIRSGLIYVVKNPYSANYINEKPRFQDFLDFFL